jgi:hypothetical protein
MLRHKGSRIMGIFDNYTGSLAAPPSELAQEMIDAISTPSLAEQKSAQVQQAYKEKIAAMDPMKSLEQSIDQEISAMLDVSGRQRADNWDLAEASLYRTGKNLYDFFTPGEDRTSEQIQQEADLAAGITEEDRYRLVGESNARVKQLLSEGRYAEAALEAGSNSLGTLADSAGTFAAIAGTSLATGGLGLAANLARGAGSLVNIGRGAKVFDQAAKTAAAADKAAKAAKATGAMAKVKSGAIAGAKAATTVSVATADITQGDANEFRAKHGRAPTIAEKSRMYALNLATMMPVPGIIKNFHIPAFKKPMKAEIKNALKNIKGGSNLKSIAVRAANTAKKVAAAGGAEAAQEYLQTWAQEINVNLTNDSRNSFWKDIQEIFGDEDSQLNAIVGAYLGGAAGGAARGITASPGLAAGTALDATKGAGKVAAKTLGAVARGSGRVAKYITDEQSYKILSQEDRDLIMSDHASRKVSVDRKVSAFRNNIKTIEAAKNLDQLMEHKDIAPELDKKIQEKELTDDMLQEPEVVKALMDDVVSDYKGDIIKLQTELAAHTGASFATKAGENVATKAKDAATAAIEAIAPTAKEVEKQVRGFGAKTVQAAKDLRSSTARGIVKVVSQSVVDGTVENSKELMEAARTLERDDLKNVAKIIGKYDKGLSKKMLKLWKKKEKIIEGAGLKGKDIITADTLNKVIKDVSNEGNIPAGNVSEVSSAVNEALSGKIDDQASYDAVSTALDLIEKSPEFKAQRDGAMSRNTMVINRRRLEKAKQRLDFDLEEATDDALDKTADIVEKTVNKAGEVVDKVVEKVVKTAGKASRSETAEKIVKTSEKIAKKVEEKLTGAATEIERQAMEKAVEKIPEIYTPEFKGEMAQMVELVQAGEKGVKAVMDIMPEFLELMQERGITTRADFELFIDQVPEVADNQVIFKELDEAYPTDMITDEAFDNITTKAVNTKDKIVAWYNETETRKECKIS